MFILFSSNCCRLSLLISHVNTGADIIIFIIWYYNTNIVYFTALSFLLALYIYIYMYIYTIVKMYCMIKMWNDPPGIKDLGQQWFRSRLVDYVMQSRYLNKCRYIVIWNLWEPNYEKILSKYIDFNSRNHPFVKALYKISVFLFRSQCVNLSYKMEELGQYFCTMIINPFPQTSTLIPAQSRF